MSQETLPGQQSTLELRPVLLVDDDERAQNVIDTMLEATGIVNPRRRLRDGVEAQEFLTAALEEGTLPSLIVLDAHMPRCSGPELLAWMHLDPRLEEVPVIMLTGDSDIDLIAEAYAGGAALYLVKPVSYEALERALHTLDRPWALA